MSGTGDPADGSDRGSRFRDDAPTPNAPNDASPTALLAYATLLTAVVAVLAGYAADFVLFAPLSLGFEYPSMAGSDLATPLTTRTLQALFWTVVALYLAVPVAVTTSLTDRGDRHPLYAVVWSAAAVVALPLLGAVANLLAPRPFQPLFALGLAATVGLPLAAGHLLAVRLAPDGAGARPPAATFAAVAVAALFLVVSFNAPLLVPATLDVPTPGLPGSDAHVEQLRYADAMGEFRYDYRPTGDGRGVLTITFRRGLGSDRLVVHGYGFAAVPGVDQTGPGPWRGERNATTGAVEPGDSVAVGVAAGCEIQLRVGNHTLVDEYRCPDGGGDGKVRPPRPEGGG